MQPDEIRVFRLQAVIKPRKDWTMVILSVQEAAKFLGKTPAALRNGYKRWGVPHFRLGGQIKFTQEALQEWVEKGMTVDQEGGQPVKNGRRTRRQDAKATSHSGAHA